MNPKGKEEGGSSLKVILKGGEEEEVLI